MTQAAIAPTALLARKIRFASEPDNPELLRHWLDAPVPHRLQSQASQRHYYRLQYQLLRETISDEFVPEDWRCRCLESIYQPLQRLEQLAQSSAEKREVRDLYFEVAMMSRCCRPPQTLH
ncbi:hypothetical protein ABMA57_09415 [Saccharospirillum sp. HFRX-1]|uniref:hypothetical protein n=1 Tax=unclassified Saccharospirillum TaxID=2633430 RepID=UPI0037185245